VNLLTKVLTCFKYVVALYFRREVVIRTTRTWILKLSCKTDFRNILIYFCNLSMLSL
jgi:hypothetical protein